MRNFKFTFWGGLLLLVVLWVIAEPAVFQAGTFMDWRKPMIQLTGVIAMGCMGFAMLLALRPRWLEKCLVGLDKMYRLHKWLGISALVFSIMHWLWAKGPKWAVEWGWMEKAAKGKRIPPDNVIEVFLTQFRHTAESVGEWTFYAIVALIVLALLKYFPYRWFYKTHRLMAVAFLAFVFHTVVLFQFNYWATPLGVVIVALLVTGTWSALVSLVHRIGQRNKMPGEIMAMRYFPGVRALAIEAEVKDWPGHEPGQFVFATSSAAEGAHPYTIASGWDPKNPRLMFVVKELGDHTARLREKLKIGQKVTIEGPYGCFTFNDDRPHQIWIGGGIGITPFIARMQTIAGRKEQKNQTVDLFHTTAEVDEQAFENLKADARSAGVQLHLTIDDRDGYLTAATIRNLVPNWHEASIWFCGPTAFAEALKRDFAAQGFPVEKHFHQELFSMR
ncbi:MAG: ferric reductase-like transmembrane domain-containing protein [Methylobacillus sp.]|jgi:predicted ferric reductase|nr:ferric reductase-like transmembrane domain-containing protein [Methylobacillus sp.]